MGRIHRLLLLLFSSVHDDVRALVEAHVCITQQTAGHFGEDFVIARRQQENGSLLRQPPAQIGERNHFRDVVTVLFACKTRKFTRSMTANEWKFKGDSDGPPDDQLVKEMMSGAEEGIMDETCLCDQPWSRRSTTARQVLSRT